MSRRKSTFADKTLVGVDGCPGGWICVARKEEGYRAFVVESAAELVRRVGRESLIAIDVPIGLTESGPRQCDIEARKLLGWPRMCSVFSPPFRPALNASSYKDACEQNYAAGGKKLSRQAYGILRKIREVDDLLLGYGEPQKRLSEVHPEVSFLKWAGRPMRHNKKSEPGRAERQALIEQKWPGLHDALREQLRGQKYGIDDLNDALGALWTAERIVSGEEIILPTDSPRDRHGLPMTIRA